MVINRENGNSNRVFMLSLCTNVLGKGIDAYLLYSALNKIVGKIYPWQDNYSRRITTLNSKPI